MSVVKLVKEQVLGYVISGILGVVVIIGLFHFTSQPIRSSDVREKLVEMARACMQQQLATNLTSVVFDSVTSESLDLSTSNSVVVYGKAVSANGALSRFLMIFEPSGQSLIDKVIGRPGFYDIGYWAIIPGAENDEVVASSMNIEDLDKDGNKDILIRLKSTYADGVSKGLLILKKDKHDVWHLMGLPSMTKIMHSIAAGQSPLPKGLQPALPPIHWFSNDKKLKPQPNYKQYLDWEIDESNWQATDAIGNHSFWMIRNGTKIKMYENEQAGYKQFGVLANIYDDEAIQGNHHLMVSFFKIENNSLIPDQHWNWAYPMFSIGLEDSQAVDLSEMQEAGLQAHVAGGSVVGLTEFGKMDSD
ncbi:hypothetical protein [Erwinia sp. OPT-41]|uniref:VCBS repeat-containing protein n=1 Tax=Erwinia plantamica TaxID=3237104 RepID=A0ABW7CJZ2_9GAMM|nr:hypothetical protein [Klebsiella quasipneumoniae subsp. similipneumoniae]